MSDQMRDAHDRRLYGFEPLNEDQESITEDSAARVFADYLRLLTELRPKGPEIERAAKEVGSSLKPKEWAIASKVLEMVRRQLSQTREK